MRIVPAQPAEHVAALQLLFAHLPPAQATTRVEGGLALLEDGVKPPGRLLVARAGRVLLGAVLAQVLPGATGVLWPPVAAAGAADARGVEDALLFDALVWLRRGGARLAQSVLAREDAHLGAALLRGGFTRPSELVFLQRKPQEWWSNEKGGFQRYLRAPRQVFEEVLVKTFSDSLDFPEIEGRLRLSEMLQGYRTAGYDPANWWLRINDRGRGVGVMILSALPGNVWDLTYVGVVPEARMEGHGRALVRKALGEAHLARAEALNVSVDGRNMVALRLYLGLGFEEYDRRDVFLLADLAS